MRIHKEGYRIIFIVFLLLGLLNLVWIPLHHLKGPFFYSLLILSILFFILVVLFFRKPSRSMVYSPEAIIAPADGKVVAIEEVFEDSYFKAKRLQISVFMSPLNVHINYVPINGTVVKVKHEPGNYLVAWHPKSSSLNEHTSVVIKQDDREIMVRQIAGAVARRIVTYPVADTEVTQGEELGFIKFGSRVDLFLPLDAKINVSIDQAVRGKKTIMASWK